MDKIKMLYQNNKAKAQTFPSINPVVAEILLNRGLKTEKEMTDFIEKSKGANYGEMKGIKLAAIIIAHSVKNDETIVIYGDTDVDGCMSCAVGMKLLGNVTNKVYYYTNNKFRDGYGLCKTGINNILKMHPTTKLIITADNGVAAMDIAYAKEKGLNVVVTDHHEPPKDLPPADVIVDPKQIDCTYEFKELCGAGVLYKVLKETYKILGIKEEKADEVLDLVAFATVGDIVPLVNENRLIVDKGLELINEKPSLAFQIIKEVMEIKEVSSHSTIAYHLSPMINALSRMTGSIDVGVELFLSDDVEEITNIIKLMQEKNEERKKITDEIFEECKKNLKIPLKEKIIVVLGEGLHEGVIGIVAGKLKEMYNRPAMVLTTTKDDENIARGSARSISEFHMKNVFDKIQEEYNIFEQYGGHGKAAGLTIKKENFEKLKKYLNTEADKMLTEENLTKIVSIDATIESKDLTVELIEDMQKLGPFGEGFPEPIFGINFNYTDIYKMGKEKQHVKYLDRFTDTSVIMWNGAKLVDGLKKLRKKAIGTLSVNEYRDKKTARLIVIDELLF